MPAASSSAHQLNWGASEGLQKATPTLGGIDRESEIFEAHLKREATESFCACVRFGANFLVSLPIYPPLIVKNYVRIVIFVTFAVARSLILLRS